MKTVIFGCGKIANRVSKGFDLVKANQLVGFASTDIEKAKQYAQKYNVPLYGNYDLFLNDPSIDAVYVTTYNLNHYQLVKLCLEHHKHVICEKPMPLTVKEVDDLFKVAKENNVLLMEALKSVFLPINIKVKQMVKEEVIGKISHIEASFVRNGDHPIEHWINDIRCGVLKDLGNYCVGTINFLLDKKPTIKYKHKNNTDTCSDRTAELILDYDGIYAHILVSNEINGDSCLRIYGTKGYIVIPDFWKTGDGYYVVDNVRYELHEEMLNDFYYEIQHFSDCINNNKIQSDVMSYLASRNIIEINE